MFVTRAFTNTLGSRVCVPVLARSGVVASRRCYTQTQDAVRELEVEKLTGKDEGIVVLTMNRPKARNALGRQLLDELKSALSEIQFDPSVRVTILRSSVPRVFCAGADLKERVQMTPTEVARFVSNLRSTFVDIERLPCPTIAAIDGACLGGGLEMAMSCDLRVSGTTALMGLPETGLAIIPGAGGTQRLPRLIGIARAKELIYTGKRLNGAEAFKIGLVNDNDTDTDSMPKALELARSISHGKGPVALRMAKLAIDNGMQTDLATAMAIEQQCYAQVIPTQDRLEGLAAFREKRSPVYKGV
eukprot:TRINITY_DN2532_c0_g1_i1.p1 TRINITY_DN2532_c0_g1~~TRINITY_DN2532_c0_g1_i1.p1  ORF type:complete len:321 (-),score=39.01 TRINITY_DN2532_c0_g1_i1:46-951(-)